MEKPVKKAGQNFMMVGTMGAGKTFFTRQMIEGVNNQAFMVFDVNDEWDDLYPYPFDPDMDDFLGKVYDMKRKQFLIKNAVIIIEDATSFFAVQGRNDLLIKILVARRHSGNTTILLFHSWGDVPMYLYRKMTAVVCFKTLDAEDNVKRSGNLQILEAWRRVQKDCENHKFFSTYPPPPGEVPPSEIVRVA